MKSNLLIISGPLGGGGAERVLMDFLNNLDYSKYNVDLCLMVNQGILLSEIPKNVSIITLWEKYTLYYKIAYRFSKWFKNNFLFKRIIKQKLTKKYDIEISFLEGMPLKLHALMETKAKKITWVHCDLYNFHYTNHQFSKGEELAAYNKMDIIVCVSDDALQAFEKRFPTCTTSREVIYNPIDINRILQLADEGKTDEKQVFTIITVGRLTPPKKIDRIIRLASRFKKEDIKAHFQILGDGELKEELLALRKELEVEDRVEFTGFVKNPYPYIKNVDMMLMCSGFEGFGLVICEAMCLGIPVISTKTAGPTEIIDNDKYGLLCEHDDEAIYLAVKKMMNDEELKDRYIIAGQERAKDFSVEKMMTRFDELTETLLEKS